MRSAQSDVFVCDSSGRCVSPFMLFCLSGGLFAPSRVGMMSWKEQLIPLISVTLHVLLDTSYVTTILRA